MFDITQKKLELNSKLQFLATILNNINVDGNKNKITTK